MRPVPPPTDAELALLEVLWDRGEATVREVHEATASGTAYTTTLTLLQRLHDKGLVSREAEGRGHRYRAAVPAEAVRGQLVADLAERAFGGSAAALAMQALSDQRATPDELDALRRLLDRLEAP